MLTFYCQLSGKCYSNTFNVLINVLIKNVSCHLCCTVSVTLAFPLHCITLLLCEFLKILPHLFFPVFLSPSNSSE